MEYNYSAKKMYGSGVYKECNYSVKKMYGSGVYKECNREVYKECNKSQRNLLTIASNSGW